MIIYLIILFQLIFQIKSQETNEYEEWIEWSKNDFEELCSLQDPEDFLHKYLNFTYQYYWKCDSGTYYQWIESEKYVDCASCPTGSYLREGVLCCSCGNGFVSIKKEAT